jgi:hypothetical protein
MIQPYLSDSSAMALVQFLEPRCEMRMTEFPDADDDLALNEVDKGTDGGTVKEVDSVALIEEIEVVAWRNETSKVIVKSVFTIGRPEGAEVELVV